MRKVLLFASLSLSLSAVAGVPDIGRGRICTMQFAVMINPSTGECRDASNGCVISDLRAQGFEIAQEGQCAKPATDTVTRGRPTPKGRPTPNGDPAADLEARMAEVDGQVKELIADLSCSNDSHCQTIAYGSRACGGPATYLVYSAKNVNTVDLTDLAARYTKLNAQYNAVTGAISICSMAMPPATACKANVCVEDERF